MSSQFSRRSFLTRSAATLGGIAVAGSVVDGFFADFAEAAIGVNSGKPRIGGTLTVGTLSDVPNYHTFNGSQGKMDASGFCVANALYDPLFVMSHDGRVALPMLAQSATPNSDYTVWTIVLHRGAYFTNGDEFNAEICVKNYQAAAADPTVGLAIQPLVASVTMVDAYTVAYNMVIPFTTLPVFLAEQQVGYMAHPDSFVPTYTGKPIGTGPFKVKSWVVGVESQFTRNENYWRSDAAGRRLPYLNAINFKTIVDSASRNEALQTGAVDIMLQQTGTQINALKHMANVSMVTDIDQPSDAAVNFLICNTTSTLNQYFCWAGEFASIGVPGSLSYIEKGEAPPAAVQDADYLGTLGAVNPSTLQWDTSLKPVINDLSIRKACAMAINRKIYFRVIDDNVGAVANGAFRTTSRYYKNPGYPSYNPARARALVDAYKSANGLSKVSFVIDILSDDAVAQQAFSFFQQQLSAVGITVTPRPLVQSTLINNVIYGEYDCATWNQFGAVDPSLNYVWWLSLPATTAPPDGLGMSSLPAGTNIAGAVNFAHQGDPTVENAMLAALGSRPGSATTRSSWETVNQQFAQTIPYLWLDVLVNAWAARNHVQNWCYATAGDGTTRMLSPDQGACRWDQIWLTK